MSRKNEWVRFFRAMGFILGLFVSGSAFAQQDPQFTQYLSAGTFFNPASAGKEGGLQFAAFHRTQWQGYTTTTGAGTAPTTQLIALQGRLTVEKI